MRSLFTTVFLFITFLFVGCSDEDKPVVITPKQTILVYMAGENSLSSFTYANMKSIISGAATSSIENCNLLIYTDTKENVPKLYKIEKNKLGVADSVLVRTYTEHNSADKDMMNSIISDVFETYPAEEKGLFLWSHGTAWLPSNLNSYLRSFGQDGTSHMEITELNAALPDGIDYIIFDACYMASAEVIYEIKDKAKYIVASSTEIMGDGFPYHLTVPILLEDKALETRLIDAATSFYNYYNAQSGAYQTGNISVVRTSDFDKLVTSCRNIFSGRYAEEYMVDPSEYGLDVQALEYLTSPYQYSFLYDLADYVSVLDESNTLDTTSIVYKDTTPKSFFAQPYRSMPIDTYCGLSIYVPQTKNPKMNEWYKQLKWYKAVYE